MNHPARITPWMGGLGVLPMLLLLAMALLPALSACNLTKIQSRREFFLNPDGSGKVRVDIRFREFDDDDKPILRDRGHLIRVFDKGRRESEGIAALRDVRIEAEGRGWNRFRFTVYFRDLSVLKLEDLGEFTFRYHLETRADGLRLKARYVPMENIIKDFSRSTRKAVEEKKEGQWIAREKMDFDRLPPEKLLSGDRFEEVLHLPGRIVESSNFARGGADSLRILLTDERLMAAYRATFTERSLREMLAARSAEPARGRAMAILFGKDAPLSATIAPPLNPFFDYQAEVAKARMAWPALRKKLGIEAEEE